MSDNQVVHDAANIFHIHYTVFHITEVDVGDLVEHLMIMFYSFDKSTRYLKLIFVIVLIQSA